MARYGESLAYFCQFVLQSINEVTCMTATANDSEEQYPRPVHDVHYACGLTHIQ
jgi:hypothetical protein